MSFPRTSTLLLALLVVVATLTHSADAFSTVQKQTVPASTIRSTALNVFGKKKEEEDLSYIESRDMTREEMLALNAKNEEIMNMELTAMTGFSLVLSLPILYLCWVAFFSD
ncbi:unnamed protein product [Pseudo-nitzschia multistriata]|uniref:ER membrane protein complex subunit 3 n=1 Tax=Pseudo-nitzschia multistriata TaxID=183589 RepID=A0A448Z796_9STRA|nr:unnamed protein product [Pseudo-nitzschia multistriata]